MTSTTTEMSSSTTGIFNNGTDGGNSTNTNNTNVFPTPTFDPHDETVNAESTIVLSLFGSIAIVVLTTMMLYRYANWRKTPWYASVVVWFSWFFSVSIVLLLPIDVTAALHAQCRSDSVSCTEPWVHWNKDALLVIWRIIYWITFVNSWTITPIMQSYVVAYHFHFHERLIRAIKDNLLIYGIAGGLGLILIIWVLIELSIHGIHFGSQELMGIAMAISNAYGLLMVILLLGYGLTEIPKHLWWKSVRKGVLKFNHFQAYVLLETYEKQKAEFDTTLKLIRKYDDKIKDNSELRIFMDRIVQKCPLQYKEFTQGEGEVELTYDKLVQLHGKLVQSMNQLNATRGLYEENLKKAIDLEDAIKSKRNPRKTIEWTNKRKEYPFTHYLVRAEWYYKNFMEKWIWRSLSVFCAIMSCTVVWSETLFSVKRVDLSVFSWLVNGPGDIPYVFSWFFIFVPIAYISLCAYWTLFQLKIPRLYRMVPHQLTDSASILFNAYYITRIIPSMAYNYLLLIKVEGSAFETVMGAMNLNAIPWIGEKWSVYFPMVLILFCLANLFNFYSTFVHGFIKLFKCCIQDAARFDYDEDFSDQRIDKGKDIVAQEREYKKNGQGLSIDIGVSLLKMKKQTKTNANEQGTFGNKLGGLFKWGNKKNGKSNDNLEMQEKRSNTRGVVPLEDV